MSIAILFELSQDASQLQMILHWMDVFPPTSVSRPPACTYACLCYPASWPRLINDAAVPAGRDVPSSFRRVTSAPRTVNKGPAPRPAASPNNLAARGQLSAAGASMCSLLVINSRVIIYANERARTLVAGQKSAAAGAAGMEW